MPEDQSGERAREQSQSGREDPVEHRADERDDRDREREHAHQQRVGQAEEKVQEECDHGVEEREDDHAHEVAADRLGDLVGHAANLRPVARRRELHQRLLDAGERRDEVQGQHDDDEQARQRRRDATPIFSGAARDRRDVPGVGRNFCDLVHQGGQARSEDPLQPGVEVGVLEVGDRRRGCRRRTR